LFSLESIPTELKYTKRQYSSIFEGGWNSKNEVERLKDKEEGKKLLNILPVRV
jgi:hypothetical protein